jgi:hypothetical protein
MDIVARKLPLLEKGHDFSEFGPKRDRGAGCKVL